MSVRVRFAPSPTGLLHRGHAFAALFAADTARRGRGRFLLRIEDIDSGRCRPHFVAAIREDLAWLGRAWDEPVRLQSQHMDTYRAALDRLAARGVLYPCFCTRRDIATEIARAGAAPGPVRPAGPGRPCPAGGGPAPLAGPAGCSPGSKAGAAAAEDTGPEMLGKDPATGLEVERKSGRFGPYIQLGEGKALDAGGAGQRSLGRRRCW